MWEDERGGGGGCVSVEESEDGKEDGRVRREWERDKRVSGVGLAIPMFGVLVLLPPGRTTTTGGYWTCVLRSLDAGATG